jgi:biopolymer transport protein TolQ
MAGVLAHNSMWGLVFQSDFMTKMVLLVLFAMSVLSWAIALYKIILFRIKKQQCKKVMRALKDVSKFEDLFAVTSMYSKTLPGYFLTRVLGNIKELLLLQDGMHSGYVQDRGMDFLQMQTDGLIDELVYQEESYLSVMSASAAAAPLLGLFGTVWGLVHAFMSISEKQSADIAAVAPGIAEALITTVAGLLVAIPALLLFNYIVVQVKRVEYDLVMLSDKSLQIARLLILQKNTISMPKKAADSVFYSEQ